MAEYIKREDVLELAKRGFIVGNRNYSSVVAFINDVPSADVVERKRGKWAGNKRHQSCSECHMTYCVPDGQDGELDMTAYHFCPNCGADMRGE